MILIAIVAAVDWVVPQFEIWAKQPPAESIKRRNGPSRHGPRSISFAHQLRNCFVWIAKRKTAACSFDNGIGGVGPSHVPVICTLAKFMGIAPSALALEPKQTGFKAFLIWIAHSSSGFLLSSLRGSGTVKQRRTIRRRWHWRRCVARIVPGWRDDGRFGNPGAMAMTRP